MNVRVSALSNGLRVATDSMESVETASVGVWVAAGTRAETAEINGVAHFLEHMAFKGTTRRSALQIASEIEDVGGVMNAYTGRETTAYYVKVMKDDLPLAVDLLSDILQNPAFDPEEMERERSVILQEIGLVQDTPEDVVFDRFQETAFPGQSMGFPVLGRAETVRAMSRQALTRFMEEGYGAGDMVLVAAGRVEHDEVVDLAERHFGALAAGRKSAGRAPSNYAGGEFREPRETEQVHLVLGFPGVGYNTDDHYTASALAMLLGGGMSSRLFQEIREKRGLVYSVYAFSSSFSDCGVFGVYAGTGERQVAELLPVVGDQIVGLAGSIGDEELKRAKAQIRAGTVMSLESPSSRAEQLGSQLLLFGRPVPVAEQLAAIEAIDVAALEGVARRLFDGPLTLAAIGPLGRLEPFDAVRARLAA